MYFILDKALGTAPKLMLTGDFWKAPKEEVWLSVGSFQCHPPLPLEQEEGLEFELMTDDPMKPPLKVEKRWGSEN